jgi:hypothetical protein
VTKKAASTERFSDDQLIELLSLTSDADSVELKVTVPESDHRSTAAALGMDVLDAQIRQVYFFDLPTLTLNDQGLIVRARRIQGKTGDAVVKVRPVSAESLSPDLRASADMSVEVDVTPGGYVCSATLKSKVKNDATRQVAAGTLPIGKLFSKDQRKFFKQQVESGVDLDDLSILGPINVFKLKFNPRGFDRAMVAELWMYPDYSRILELSTKCPPNEVLQVAGEARAFLTGRGVELGGEQQMKTKTALEFFSKQLADMQADALTAGSDPDTTRRKAEVA